MAMAMKELSQAEENLKGVEQKFEVVDVDSSEDVIPVVHDTRVNVIVKYVLLSSMRQARASLKYVLLSSEYSMEVDTSDTVGSIKGKIAKKLSVYQKFQSIRHSSNSMDLGKDESTLAELGVSVILWCTVFAWLR